MLSGCLTVDLHWDGFLLGVEYLKNWHIAWLLDE